MTCIVGLVHNDRVWIGGDSAGVSTQSLGLAVRADRKVFSNGAFVFGFTSSFRMGQLLAYAFTPPAPRQGADLMAFMVGDFIDAVRKCLKDGGYATVKDSVETGGQFLVGYAGRLFNIEPDFQVGESVLGFDACGCAQDVALGSLHATRGADPQARLGLALEAAEAFSAGVRSPFHFVATL